MTPLLIFCGFCISGLHDMPSDARAFSMTSFEAYSSFCCQIRLLGSLFLS